MPDGFADVTVQRIVVRNGLSRDLAAELLADIDREVAHLDALQSPMPQRDDGSAFHH